MSHQVFPGISIQSPSLEQRRADYYKRASKSWLKLPIMNGAIYLSFFYEKEDFKEQYPGGGTIIPSSFNMNKMEYTYNWG